MQIRRDPAFLNTELDDKLNSDLKVKYTCKPSPLLTNAWINLFQSLCYAMNKRWSFSCHLVVEIHVYRFYVLSGLMPYK